MNILLNDTETEKSPLLGRGDLGVRLKVLIIIPSRFGSTRFEGKPLVDIYGKSLVQRTYLQALKANLDAEVLVATDDERIYNHVLEFGNCVMTSTNHQSGTDRCFEAAEKWGKPYDVLVNLQGDEPFILPTQIENLVNTFKDKAVKIATLKKRILTAEDLLNTNMVKVITDSNEQAIYFSRHTLPYFRGVENNLWLNHFEYYRHVGIYAFSYDIIAQLKNLKPSALEIAESLEQLRWIENGFKLNVVTTDFISPAIDTPEDLLKVKDFLVLNPNML